MNMVNTSYNSIEDMVDKLQQLKSKTKLNFHENLSKFYDEVNIKNVRFEEDPFAKNAQGVSKIYPEVLLLMKFLQTKPQDKNMNNNYYDLYYRVIKNKYDKEIVNDEYENDYINFNDIIAYHFISIKHRETTLM